MGSNNLDSKESLWGWVWSSDAMTMKSSCKANSWWQGKTLKLGSKVQADEGECSKSEIGSDN